MLSKHKNLIMVLTLGALAIMLGTSAAFGRAMFDQSRSRDAVSRDFDDPPCLTLGVHNVGNIGFTLANNGQFGTGYLDIPAVDPMTGLPAPSCEYPLGSGNENLFAGTLWIGAIVGEDTLVSVGADGWHRVNELFPKACPDGDMIYRSIYGPDGPNAVSDQDFEAVYFDTLTDPAYVDIDPLDNRPHIPLNVEITQKSYSWSDPKYDDFVIVEYAIKNIGTNELEEACVGLYVDGDVIADGEMVNEGATDDMCGFLHTAPSVTAPPECGFVDEVNIAWIADNDGRKNPHTGCPDDFNIRDVTGIRLLQTPLSDTNLYSFNWWISNTDTSYDWGPRQEGTTEDPFRDFGGFLGTPVGDANKYYIMNHHEIDYDQLFAAVDHTSEGWLPPSSMAQNIADGIDTRYLLSFGPINIGPGEILQFHVAYVAGADFHTDCGAFDDLFDPDDPQAYYDQLNFDNLVANATAAFELFDIPGVDTDGNAYRGRFRICDSDTFWYEGDGVSDLKPLGYTLEPKQLFKPDPQTILYTHAYPAVMDTVFIGQIEGFIYDDVDPASVMINGTIPPTDVTVLNYHPEFYGKVLRIVFPAKVFIEGYGIQFGESVETYTVTGDFISKQDFTFEGEVTIIGHLLGDVTGDDAVNLLDLSYLINFIYVDGPAPVHGREYGDINRDGRLNLLDILKLIEIIYY
jgi:hypothetical protein